MNARDVARIKVLNEEFAKANKEEKIEDKRRSKGMAKSRAVATTRTRYVSRAKVHRHKSQMTIPLAVVAGFLPLASDIYYTVKGGSFRDISGVMMHDLIGYNQDSGKFDTQRLSQGLYPIAAGFGVHWLAGKIGINRMLGRMRVPFIRI